MTQKIQHSSNMETQLSGEERVEVVYALAAAAKHYKIMSMGIDRFLSWLDDKPIEHIPDRYLAHIIKQVPEFTLPQISYWKQRLDHYDSI